MSRFDALVSTACSVDDSNKNFKSYLRWTNDMKHILAKKVCEHRAYIPSFGKNALTLVEKWQRVKADLIVFKEFYGFIDKGWESLQAQFNRFKDEVLKEAGISEEGANLSGLNEEPSEYQLLMINMAEEYQIKKQESKEKKEKKEKLQKVLLENEKSFLKRSLPEIDNVVNSPEVSTLANSSTSDLSTEISTKKVKRDWFDNVSSSFVNLVEQTKREQ